MSAGRSFHSVSGLWFWKDWPGFVPGGGGWFFEGNLAIDAAGFRCVAGSKCTGDWDVDVRLESVGEEKEMSRWTTQAVSGRSLI